MNIIRFNSIKYDLNFIIGIIPHLHICFNSIKYDLNEVEGMYKEHISSFNSIKYDLNILRHSSDEYRCLVSILSSTI